jgi:superfamily II RNA helicase
MAHRFGQSSASSLTMIQVPAGESPLGYLAYTLPPSAADITADDVLSRFLDYAAHRSLELYPAQEEAVLELLSGKNVILSTPTGSGKSLVATALHFDALVRHERSIYTAPIKALVNEKFFALCEDFGPENVGLLTGDAAVNREAPILCCTAEILANIGLREGASTDLKHVVVDEFHYYSDRDRGTAWQIPLLTMPHARFLLMSATFGDPSPFAERLTRLTRLETKVVKSTERPVPLDFAYSESPLHETLSRLISDGKSPVYVVHFTQRACAEEAQNLMSQDFSTKEEKRAIIEALRGARFDTAFGKELQRFLRHGVGLHHAGLLPKYRLLVEKLAQRGLLKVVVGTDTLGVGVNIPIRTVVLTKLCKFDGNSTSLLKVRDFLQISGRAGRRGFDTQGSIVVQAPEHVIENKRLEAKAGGDPVKLKRIVRKKPPERGYVHWDRAVFDKIIVSAPEPLVSRFNVSHGMVINVLLRGRTGCRAMARLINDCHEPRRQKRALGRAARDIYQSLVDAGIVVRESDGTFSIREDLQSDFSLHQALSLYLIETIELLDRESGTYPLDLLTLIESVLENPEVILLRQQDALKTRKMGELKAAGVEYEERIAELEKVTYPKPNAEFVYGTFNDFARRHPWVSAENIRPKSIAREMYEGFFSFNDYVTEYGLARSEGALLRYLSDVYRTLEQTVPLSARGELTEELESYLGAIVHGTDSSLVDEWERLLASEPPTEASRTDAAVALPAADRVDITSDERTFTVLLRNRLFSLLRALARDDLEGALLLLGNSEPTWSLSRLKTCLAEYYADHTGIDLSPKARAPQLLRVTERQPTHWRFEQVISDPDEHNDWAIFGTVDLEASRSAGHPVLMIERISA